MLSLGQCTNQRKEFSFVCLKQALNHLRRHYANLSNHIFIEDKFLQRSIDLDDFLSILYIKIINL